LVVIRSMVVVVVVRYVVCCECYSGTFFIVVVSVL